MPVRMLVTAFEPFDGRSENASSAALADLEVAPPPGVDLHTALLPVVAFEAGDLLYKALRDSEPQVILCLGEAGRDAINIETIGYNERSYGIPDNLGNQFDGAPILDDGPATYEATLPIDDLYQAVAVLNIPVERSTNPGRYLCNEVLYLACHYTTNQPEIVAGFVHVPLLPEAVEGKPSMPTDDVVRALRAMISHLAEAWPDQQKAGSQSL
ncbi:MAG: pyroglutamyl-peptidase I [Chloroflexi bacterium]|nr:pyroglutamyl-peptidase I [Chloroflexota bacterium]